MKILTWNVNGLRAIYKKNFLKTFKKLNADIFCLQELRAEKNELPNEIQEIKGYYSFFNPSSIKKGHSGTAIYSKIKPEKVKYKIGFKEFDKQGRIILLEYSKFILLNLYLPYGGRKKENLKFKIESYKKLFNFLKKLKKDIILLGDFNIAHKEIDLARPEENKNNIMFTIEERRQIDFLIEKLNFIDSFRLLNKKGGIYTWWPFFRNARERNLGWRIDYIFISKNLKKYLKSSFILPKIMGSDHCPSGIEIGV